MMRRWALTNSSSLTFIKVHLRGNKQVEGLTLVDLKTFIVMMSIRQYFSIERVGLKKVVVVAVVKSNLNMNSGHIIENKQELFGKMLNATEKERLLISHSLQRKCGMNLMTILSSIMIRVGQQGMILRVQISKRFSKLISLMLSKEESR